MQPLTSSNVRFLLTTPDTVPSRRNDLRTVRAARTANTVLTGAGSGVRPPRNGRVRRKHLAL